MQLGVTPSAITPAIMTLCRELVANPEPRFLTVTPGPDADANDCFPVVERYVEEHGGSICYGWQLWEWPSVMIEAEFHAVWRSSTGELRDLTPKLRPVPQVLFLPDPGRKYEGRQVSNRRTPPHSRTQGGVACTDLLADAAARPQRSLLLWERKEVQEMLRTLTAGRRTTRCSGPRALDSQAPA